MAKKNTVQVQHHYYRHPSTGHEVALIGVAHVWPREAYGKVAELMDGYRQRNFTVYHEGVKPSAGPGWAVREGNRLGNSLKSFYSTISTLSPKLAYQKDQAWFYREEDVRADLTVEELALRLGIIRTAGLAVVMTTLGASLAWVVKRGSKDVLADALLDSLTEVRAKPPLLLRIFKSGLLDERNATVVAAALGRREPALLPWGMAHCAGIADLLEDEGYFCITSENVPVKFR